MNVGTETPKPEAESSGDSGLHYPDLRIENFRGIKELYIPSLGRVNLITGKNNTGKSTVLEALRLHANNGSLSVIGDILTFREEYPRYSVGREPPADHNGPSPITALFHGFPTEAEEFGPVAIETKGNRVPKALGIRVDWFVSEEDEEGFRRLIPLERAKAAESDRLLALVIETEERRRTLRLSRLKRYLEDDGETPTRPLTVPRMPCVFASPYSAERTDSLAQLWDEIALTEYENQALEALRIIEPEISGVSMVGWENNPWTRRAIVKLEGMPGPVPLRSLGDGVNRLFSIALSLVNARGGILLIDEFENGLHYSVQPNVWRMIFELAGSLEVQVFATTHSGDAVKGFQQAAAKSPQEGMLVRLVSWGGKHYVTLADEDNLEIITESGIEVR